MATRFADRYEIQKKIGRGAFGTVYLALDMRLSGRKVVLKILYPALNADPATVCLFDNEAGALASLEHDNIVTVYDDGVWEDRRTASA